MATQWHMVFKKFTTADRGANDEYSMERLPITRERKERGGNR